MEVKGFDFMEFKALSQEGEFEGYASVFNNVDSDNDRVAPGAFVKTLKKTNGKVPILAGHATRDQIGWNISAEEDSKGLKVHGRLNLDVQIAREKYALVKQAMEVGARMGLSIGYLAKKVGWDGEVRLLEEVELFEYSLLPFPSNDKARVMSVKGDLLTNVRDFEAFLRDAGFSRSRAKTIASLAFKSQRDAEQEVLAAIERVTKSLTS